MKRKWFKLDNAAKIFPSSSGKKDPKVFRFVCELKENIEPLLLQQAVNYALEIFPNFQVILKNGLFWQYLETTNMIPKVKLENKPICTPIYNKNRKRLLFRVNYYKNRINLEVYHVLSDGTGALDFLKIIVTEYCNLKYNLNIPFDYDSSFNELSSDSFNKYYKKQEQAKHSKYKIYRFKGEILSDYRFHVIQGYFKTSELLEISKKYNTTLTGLIISIYIKSVLENMNLRDKKKTIVIDVPVNLRKYFKSNTSRNFFSVVKIPYKDTKEDLESIINYVNEYLKNELNKDNLFKKMNRFAAVEHNFGIRLIPLFFKNIILKIASVFTEKTMTSSISNVGIISVLDGLKPYVERFDVFVSTNKMQICMCSYLEKLTISFTSVYYNTDVIKNFFRTLKEFEIDISISSNKMGE